MHHINAGSRCPDAVRMVVESPRNSQNKYEYDLAPGLFRLAISLYSSLYCPGDYGFIPGTVSRKGDPLDVLAITDEGTLTGCLLDVRPIGVLLTADGWISDEKILTVPENNPRYEQIHTVDQLAPHVRLEISDFSRFTTVWSQVYRICRLARSGRGATDHRAKPGGVSLQVFGQYREGEPMLLRVKPGKSNFLYR